MVKCKECGKFLSLSSVDAAKCANCSCQFHKTCVGVSAKAKVASTWHCPTCQVGEPITPQSQTVEKIGGKDAHQLFSTPGASDSSEDLVINFRSELQIALKEIMTNMRREFQLLREDMGERISNLEKRMSAMEEKQLNQCSSPSSGMEGVIEQLKEELNDKEQELLINDIDISNLPETQGENALHTALLVATQLGLVIEERDIVSAERVGARRINATEPVSTPGLLPVRPRSLVVRLARRDLRDQWLASARTRRGVTSADLKLPGPPVRFYVNERLTKQNRLLFRQARELGNRLGWKYVWTKRGQILGRQRPLDTVCRIRNASDLQRVFHAQAESSK